MTEDGMTKERRKHQRIRYQAPATVTTGQHSIAASTKDISDRGYSSSPMLVSS